jgi:phenylacetate-coenzyme A ligase PaaK-like adenylate-forming protein
VALILYEFPEISTPSAEYQIVRPQQPSKTRHVRWEYDPARLSDVGGITHRLTERFRDPIGVELTLELVTRGSVPRFAYKAARVGDE